MLFFINIVFSISTAATDVNGKNRTNLSLLCSKRDLDIDDVFKLFTEKSEK